MPKPTTHTSASWIVTSVLATAPAIAPSTIAGARSSISSSSSSYSCNVTRLRSAADLIAGVARPRNT
ncbi:MAG TPA: hypothetical protein VGR41_04285 [Actinomycetota bacterium]|nr:hypothetical protein [Actinomycetota bacterium]